MKEAAKGAGLEDRVKTQRRKREADAYLVVSGRDFKVQDLNG